MTEKEYRQKVLDLMSKFIGEIHNELVDLTIKFIKDNPDRHYDSVFLPDDQRKIDTMAFTTGWLEDRLNGLNYFDTQNSRKSRTKKIRKALGYTS